MGHSCPQEHTIWNPSGAVGRGDGTTQAFPAFLQVKELLGRSSDTLTQTRHGRCSWSGTWSVPDTRNTHRVKVKLAL